MDTKSLTKALLLLVVCAIGQARAQDDNLNQPALPITNSNSAAAYYKLPSLAQQQAMHEAEQRMLRMEWRAWTNQSPLRPTMNASFMVGGYQTYYVPQRGILVNSGHRGWYW
ncbi:MAG: hypothetical protein U0930_19060 [Pirellulales bacterium]